METIDNEASDIAPSFELTVCERLAVKAIVVKL